LSPLAPHVTPHTDQLPSSVGSILSVDAKRFPSSQRGMRSHMSSLMSVPKAQSRTLQAKRMATTSATNRKAL